MLNKRTIYITTAVCVVTLLVGCNNDANTTVSDEVITSEATVGAETHEPVTSTPLLTPSYGIGANSTGTLKYGNEIGGSFRVSASYGSNTVDYDLMYTDVSGLIGANIYINLPDGMSLDTFLLATELPFEEKDITNIADNTYFYFTEDPQLPGFDTHISQKSAYEAVCDYLGIDPDKAPNAPTDKLSIDTGALTLRLGETKVISVTHIPEGYSTTDLTYSTEDSSIAEVTENGALTAISKGATAVTVSTSDGKYFAQGITVVTD